MLSRLFAQFPGYRGLIGSMSQMLAEFLDKSGIRLKRLGLTVLEFSCPVVPVLRSGGGERLRSQSARIARPDRWVESPCVLVAGGVCFPGRADRVCGDCRRTRPPCPARAAALYDGPWPGITRFKFSRQMASPGDAALAEAPPLPGVGGGRRSPGARALHSKRIKIGASTRPCSCPGLSRVPVARRPWSHPPHRAQVASTPGSAGQRQGGFCRNRPGPGQGKARAAGG